MLLLVLAKVGLLTGAFYSNMQLSRQKVDSEFRLGSSSSIILDMFINLLSGVIEWENLVFLSIPEKNKQRLLMDHSSMSESNLQVLYNFQIFYLYHFSLNSFRCSYSLKVLFILLCRFSFFSPPPQHIFDYSSSELSQRTLGLASIPLDIISCSCFLISEVKL